MSVPDKFEPGDKCTCYLGRPDDPNADEEACAACDAEFWRDPVYRLEETPEVDVTAFFVQPATPLAPEIMRDLLCVACGGHGDQVDPDGVSHPCDLCAHPIPPRTEVRS